MNRSLIAAGAAAGAAAFALGLQFGRRSGQQTAEPAEQAPATPTAAAIETRPIDGKAIAAEVRTEVKEYAAQLKKDCGVVPGLAVILVGSRKDSQSYVRNKKKAAAEVDFHAVDVALPETVSQEELLAEVEKLNADPKVHAILVQLPLPKHIDEALVLKTIRVDKDADGFSAQNVGNLVLKGGDPPLAVPCTPAGCIELLQRSQVQVAGKNAVVIGRSNIVGMPVSQLLQSMDATVTVCHSRTKDMVSFIRNADVVVAAIGKAEFVRGDWLKPGCVVIDVGINAVDDATKKLGYRLVGDVNFAEAQGVASRITPVPGGVGPMTIAMLLKNTLNLARHSVGLPRVPLRRHSKAAAAQPQCAPAQKATGGGVVLPADEDIAVVMSCKGKNVWEAAVSANSLRNKVQDFYLATDNLEYDMTLYTGEKQETLKSDLPPAVVLQASTNGTAPAISLVSLSKDGKVLCSAPDTKDAVAALSGSAAAEPQACAAPATSVGAVALPKGEPLAVVMSCNGGNVWEAAVSAGTLREKVQEMSSMDLPPAVVLQGPGTDAAAVSLVSLGQDAAHSKVLCSAGALSEAVAALGP